MPGSSSSGSTSTYATANWLFLRLIGVVYLFAFWSLALQTRGLIGHDGILPAAEYMAAVRNAADANGIGLDRYRLVPTLCWLASSDRFLEALTVGGALLAALLTLGIAPVVILPLLWIAYLSLSVVARDFLSFQWDALLLEAGLLAMFVAPCQWRHRLRDATDPPLVARWLLWWLLVRLMFGSGVVKLASGDPAWRGLTALAVHYETQPLPTPVAWYVALLPLWFHQVSTALTLGIELILPWWTFFGPRLRRVAALALMALQVLIAVTGNYTFFNLLTIALCVMLLDDGAFGVVKALRRVPQEQRTAGGWRRNWAASAAAIVTIPVSAATLGGQMGFQPPSMVLPLMSAIDPLRSVNPYGLFAVMTTTRPEIVVEGSEDGVAWRAYEFPDKPGTLTRRPPWVAPFQPRLDWQMWFAALGSWEGERWFHSFCASLLAGSPSVAGLLADNPFSGTPPQFVRATLYRYRFTDWPTRRATGAWWTRERLRDYSPVLTKPD
jgi:hypothetical protein